MAINSLFDKAREAFLTGAIDWTTSLIKAVLVDGNDLAVALSTCTNASPIAVTSGAAHNLTTGDLVVIDGVVGNTAANGRWRVTVTDGTNFTLDGSTGNGAYTSGGLIYDLTGVANLSDIPGAARISTATLSTPTATFGVADADDVVFSSVTGDQSELVILYYDSTVESTSTLILFMANATGLPVTPSGGDITVQFSNDADKIFRL